MTAKSRLLGLAFASADVLLELDGSRRVAFALGAGPVRGIDPALAWTGRLLDDLLDAPSRATVAEALKGLTPGVRAAPVDVLVRCPDGQARRARMRVFELPDLAPAVSCAMTWEGAAFAVDRPGPASMLDIQGLLGRVRTAIETPGDAPDVALAFVEVCGLGAADESHQRAAARIEAVLQSASLDGASAGRMTEDRYALLRRADDSRDVVDAVRDAAAIEGVTLAVEATQATVPPGVSPGPALRALRFALEGFIREGGSSRPDLAFADHLRRTLTDSDRFRALVRDRTFELQYQPIVDLGTRATHHFEALARLGGEAGPAETIRMAEDLGLIGGFDLAVAEKALRQMRGPGFGLTKVAVNVSGASLGDDQYVSGLLRMTATAPDCRKRLIVEVTETSAITDLEAANRRLDGLRKAGVKVCLDDFGVGAASYDYLCRLTADIVKIDGGFVRDLASGRSHTLIAHLVKLCADLKMTTIAEMVETEEQAATLRALGVDQGQGWVFGRPTSKPVDRMGEQLAARRIAAAAGR